MDAFFFYTLQVNKDRIINQSDFSNTDFILCYIKIKETICQGFTTWS